MKYAGYIACENRGKIKKQEFGEYIRQLEIIFVNAQHFYTITNIVM